MGFACIFFVASYCNLSFKALTPPTVPHLNTRMRIMTNSFENRMFFSHISTLTNLLMKMFD